MVGCTSVAIRADASVPIGIGHVMRCLALADHVKRRGAHVRFISRHMPEPLRRLVRRAGHELLVLKASGSSDVGTGLSHSRWLGTSQEADAEETGKALSGRTWSWLVVDHYALDAQWEYPLRGAAQRVLVIDDIADREHDCDVLVDQNLFPEMTERYLRKVPSGCRLLLGPAYALLRREFAALRKCMRQRSGKVRRILVQMGGIDADNQTERALQALARIGSRAYDVDVVIGAQHPARKDIEALCKRHGYNCHIQTSEVARLMAGADLAIGASGSASWERCCLGLPTISITQAANQVDIAKGLDAAQATVYLGDASKVTVESLADAVVSLVRDPAKLRRLSSNGRRLVDGKGAGRVCTEMTKAI